MNLKKLNRYDYGFKDFPENFRKMLNSCCPVDNNELVDISNSRTNSPTLVTIKNSISNSSFDDVKAKLNLSEENNPIFSIEVKYVGATTVLTSLKVVKGSDFYKNNYLSYYLNDEREKNDKLTKEKEETEEKLHQMEEEYEEISKKYEELINTHKIELQKIENEHLIQMGQKENEYKENMNNLTQKYNNDNMEMINNYNEQISELKNTIDEINKKYNDLTTEKYIYFYFFKLFLFSFLMFIIVLV